ncbi:hypothetical protein EMIT0P201_11527 [Pseudomonas chlororaphis]
MVLSLSQDNQLDVKSLMGAEKSFYQVLPRH